MTLNVYRADKPTFWLTMARIFALKKYAAVTGAAASVMDTLASSAATWNDYYEHLMGMDNPAGAAVADGLALPAYFLLVAGFGHWASRGLLRRIVIGIDAIAPAADAQKLRPLEDRDAEIRAAPSPYTADIEARAEIAAAVSAKGSAHHTLVLYHMRLWSSQLTKEVIPRSAATCAPPNKMDVLFQVDTGGARPEDRILHPAAGGFSTDHPPYLASLVFGQYFRPDEAPPPPDTTLLRGIEGFGPYRPAQFADPAHPAARQLAEKVQAATAALADSNSSGDGPSPSSELVAGPVLPAGPLPGTPFHVAHDNVWASFAVPPRPTLAQRREAERLAKVEGISDPAATMAALPATSAPVTMTLDGGTVVTLPDGTVTLPPPPPPPQPPTAKERGLKFGRLLETGDPLVFEGDSEAEIAARAEARKAAAAVRGGWTAAGNAYPAAAVNRVSARRPADAARPPASDSDAAAASGVAAGADPGAGNDAGGESPSGAAPAPASPSRPYGARTPAPTPAARPQKPPSVGHSLRSAVIASAQSTMRQARTPTTAAASSDDDWDREEAAARTGAGAGAAGSSGAAVGSRRNESAASSRSSSGSGYRSNAPSGSYGSRKGDSSGGSGGSNSSSSNSGKGGGSASGAPNRPSGRR